jgi:hypothetical protein
MSTFGKKALVYWNYELNDGLRFNKTPLSLQLEILEKWYPIGYRCKFIDPGTGTRDFIYEIKEYLLKVGGFYTILVEPITLDHYWPIALKEGYNPLKLDVIDKQILKREYKLEKLLK